MFVDDDFSLKKTTLIQTKHKHCHHGGSAEGGVETTVKSEGRTPVSNVAYGGNNV